MKETVKIVNAANGGSFGSYPSSVVPTQKDTAKPVDGSKKSPKPFG